MGLASLRFRLLALVMVAVLPSIGLLLVAAREGERRAEAALRLDADRLSHLLAEDQKRSIESAQGLLTGVARMAALAAPIDPERCQAALADIRAQIPGFNNLSVADAEGNLLCAAAPLLPQGISIAHRLHYRNAVASGAFAAGEHTLARLNGRHTYYFAAPVLGPGRRLEAVVTAGLDLGEMQARLEGIALPPDATAVVTDAAGTVLAQRPSLTSIGRQLGDPLRSHLLAFDGGLFLQRDGEVERLYAPHRVAGPGDRTAMLVAVGLPTEPAHAQVRGLLLRTLAGFGGVALLAVVVALAVGERLLARPIDQVIAAARRLSRGDLTARTGLRRGRGEIGELAGAFDDMARSLEADAQAQRRLEEQLRHSQKMEAVGRLAGGVAHDFNNLLTVILSFAGFVRADLGEEHPSRPDVDEILASGERAATLTRQLLTFSRRQVIEPRLLDLAETVRGVEKMLRRLIGEDVVLETRAAPGTGRVLADPGLMEQVIVNLAVNARDAMPGGGRVVLEVADAPPGAPGLAGDAALPDGPLVRLSVTDGGVGMDEATQAHIFEPFFTTKPAGKGTGLGLSTVYGIVIQSGGAIRVRSAPGQGSTFAVYLPRAAEGADALLTSAAPACAPRRTTGSETVLLVEDDHAVRALAQRALVQAGYEVLESARPAEALDRARRHPAPIQLLLTDIILPEASGPELARQLLPLCSELRVLYMSGYTTGHVAGDVPIAGSAFLAKPFTPEQLLDHVREALECAPAPAAADGEGSAPRRVA